MKKLLFFLTVAVFCLNVSAVSSVDLNSRFDGDDSLDTLPPLVSPQNGGDLDSLPPLVKPSDEDDNSGDGLDDLIPLKK